MQEVTLPTGVGSVRTCKLVEAGRAWRQSRHLSGPGDGAATGSGPKSASGREDGEANLGGEDGAARWGGEDGAANLGGKVGRRVGAARWGGEVGEAMR